MRIDDSTIEEALHIGYSVIAGFLPPQLLADAQSELAVHLPTWEAIRSGDGHHRIVDGLGYSVFPFRTPALNYISLHPDLLDAAKRSFDGREPFLTQSVIRGSYAGVGDLEQHLHRDYTDNSLLVPSDAPAFRQLAFIVYYSDVTVDTAPTYVCPRAVSDSRPMVPRERMREDDPELYRAELPVEVDAGSLVMYTMSSFHRGSRFTSPIGYRFAHHIGLRAVGNDWMGWQAWPRRFDSEEGVACMAALDVEQRAAIGVPRPGHAFWDAQTVEAFGQRYPDVDLQPYREALAAI